MENSFKPPAGVQEEGRRALEWLKEGQAGGGFTDVGRRRAAQLANGQSVSLATIRRMASYLARHEVDKRGKGWSPGTPGYPSPGRVAWAAWGGDAAVAWTNRIIRSANARAGQKKGLYENAELTEDFVESSRRAKRRRRQPKFENLREKPIVGIETLPNGSLVSAGVSAKAAKKPKKLAATPAPKKDRIIGSAKNRVGSASSISSASGIAINDATRASLEKKVKAHNESLRPGQRDRRATIRQLMAVYRRGAGAFSVSHRPGMTRNQWAMGRVNAFLDILKKGRPSNGKYVTDNDLLPKKHPWKNRTVGKKNFESVDLEEKLLGRGGGIGRRIGRMRSAVASFNNDAIDGDGDGILQDDTEFERPANPVKKVFGKLRARKRDSTEVNDLAGLFERLKEEDGGFSVRLSDASDAKSGWAIARNGKGFVIPKEDIWDEKGKVNPRAVAALVAFLEMHQKEFSERKTRRSEVVLGAWHNPEDGKIYFDVTDVYSKKHMTREQAFKLGVERDQKSVADLDNIWAAIEDGNWDRETGLETGGTGGSVIALIDLYRLADEMLRPV